MIKSIAATAAVAADIPIAAIEGCVAADIRGIDGLSRLAVQYVFVDVQGVPAGSIVRFLATAHRFLRRNEKIK